MAEYQTEEMGVLPLIAIAAGGAAALGIGASIKVQGEAGDESGRKDAVVSWYGTLSRYAFDSGRFSKTGALATTDNAMIKRTRALLRAYYDRVAAGSYEPWIAPGNALVERLAADTGYQTSFVRDWLYMTHEAVQKGIVPAYVLQPASAPVDRPLIDLERFKDATTPALTRVVLIGVGGLVGYGLLREFLFNRR